MSIELAIADVEHELRGTRRVLERIPDEHLSWRPHEKSMTVGELATHITNLLGWQTSILSVDDFDLASVPARREALETREAILHEFDQRLKEVLPMLSGLHADEFAAEWTLRKGEHVIFRQPRLVALRTFGLSHMVHHRAQLLVYLRLLDLPLPGLYGPSADEARG